MKNTYSIKYSKTKIITTLITAIAFFVLIPTAVPAASGELDPSFGTGGRVIFTPVSGLIPVRVRVQPDGKIVTFGGLNIVWPGVGSFLSRHSANGILDTSFAGDGIVDIAGGGYESYVDMVILSNGNLLVTGAVSGILSSTVTDFRTYDTLGNRIFSSTTSSLDDTPGRRLLVQQDGKIVVVTYTGSPNFAASSLAAIRYSSNAELLDDSFGDRSLANSRVAVWADSEFWSNHYGAEFLGDATIQPDGKIVMIGSGATGTNVVRLSSSGSLDDSFGTGGIVSLPGTALSYTHPGGMIIQPDGKIVINGISAEFGLYSSFIVRLNPNGTLDQQFGTDGIVTISEPDPEARGIGAALVIQPNGKIITAGDRNGGFAMMRFDSNGVIDSSFGTNGLLITPMGDQDAKSAIVSLAWQSHRKLVATGSIGYPYPPGTPTLGFARTEVGIVRYSIDDAGLKVSGRVVTPNSLPLRNTIVALVDSQGVRRIATTGSFGLFEFDNVTQDAIYTISVSSRRYRFAPRTIQPATNLVFGDLVGLE